MESHPGPVKSPVGGTSARPAPREYYMGDAHCRSLYSFCRICGGAVTMSSYKKALHRGNCSMLLVTHGSSARRQELATLTPNATAAAPGNQLYLRVVCFTHQSSSKLLNLSEAAAAQCSQNDKVTATQRSRRNACKNMSCDICESRKEKHIVLGVSALRKAKNHRLAQAAADEESKTAEDLIDARPTRHGWSRDHKRDSSDHESTELPRTLSLTGGKYGTTHARLFRHPHTKT